jgi:pseudouridine-5'-phosphate glycosidase
VLGYETDTFPAFYAPSSGLAVDLRVDTPRQAAEIIRASRELGLPNGAVIAVPVPKEAALPPERLEAAINSALAEAQARGIARSASTPFLLKWISRETGGASLTANVALLENNAAVAAQIAVALLELA